MSFKRVFLSLLLIEVFTKCIVEGLQCYVCEQCNKNKDFKELHICGEISMTTIRTTVMPEVTDINTEKLFTTSPVVKTSTKPSEDSEETHNNVSTQKNTTQAATTTTTPTASKTVTTSEATVKKTKSVMENPITENPTTLAKEATTTIELKTTTQTLLTTTKQESIDNINMDNKTSTSTLSTEKPNPILVSDYDDYLEYEDVGSMKSLIKINKPVCYMIKYQVNNTVFTNRGCTTFINDNKYLTCQSLNNGTPLESCRVCSTNGCNKFFEDDSGEGIDGIFSNAQAQQRFDVVVLFFWIILHRSII